MYIDRLQLKGFKSFGGTHELILSPGFTAIVGPNGSGKSNLLDALRWSLGDSTASRLRVNRQSGLLFLGSQSREAAKEAEVSLRLREGDKICTIKRRVTAPDGTTSLFVDNERKTLTELDEVKRSWKLEGDRFAFIGQGEVQEVLKQSPSERRMRLETLFGIDIYRKKRMDAQNRLETVRGDYNQLRNLMGELSALSTGYGDAGNQAMVFASFDTRRDNVVTYVSPTYAGLTLHVQYAMGNSNENKSSAEGGRYGALALTYSNDALHVILHVDRLNKNHEERNGNDMVTVTGGVSYKFEPLTLYVGGQYFNNANEVGSSSYGYKLGGFGDIDGWGATIGARAPVMGGTLRVSAGYMDAESDASNEDVTRFIFGVGYEYSVTKRTSWYVAAGYTRDDDVSGNNPTMYQAVAGLRHKF